jgi:hypothetical protein
MFGPVIALICYFIAPGGALGIGGQIEPTNSAEVLAIASGDYAYLALISSLILPVGLLVFISGLTFYAQSMEGGNGYAVARLGTPMLLVAAAGWVLASGVNLGIASELITEGALADASLSLNLMSGLIFGIGALLVTYAASTRADGNSKIAYAAALASAVVAVVSVISIVSPEEQAKNMSMITGICFVVFTVWSVITGRKLASG